MLIFLFSAIILILCPGGIFNIMEKHTKNTFNSRLGFILASVGSAVGMGNIWMFPYRLGQNGGAAFLIPYFLFVALFGYVGLSGEFALGRFL